MIALDTLRFTIGIPVKRDDASLRLLRAAYAVETAADFKHSPAKWWNL